MYLPEHIQIASIHHFSTGNTECKNLFSVIAFVLGILPSSLGILSGRGSTLLCFPATSSHNPSTCIRICFSSSPLKTCFFFCFDNVLNHCMYILVSLHYFLFPFFLLSFLLFYQSFYLILIFLFLLALDGFQLHKYYVFSNLTKNNRGVSYNVFYFLYQITFQVLLLQVSFPFSEQCLHMGSL